MSVRELLEDLRGLGATVEAKDGILDLDAPAGAITEDLLNSVKEHKPKLLKLLEWERHKHAGGLAGDSDARCPGETKGALRTPDNARCFAVRGAP